MDIVEEEINRGVLPSGEHVLNLGKDQLKVTLSERIVFATVSIGTLLLFYITKKISYNEPDVLVMLMRNQ